MLLKIAVIAGMLSPALGGVAHATMIDPFSDSQTTTIPNGGGPNPVSVNNAFSAPPGVMLGGRRNVQLTRTGVGVGATNVMINSLSLMDALSWNNDSSADSNIQLIWDGGDDNIVNPLGLGGIDLTDGGASNVIRMLAKSDLGASVVITVYTDATHYSNAAFVVPFFTLGGQFVTVTQLFSAFTPGAGAAGGADFTNVGAITLNSSGPVGLDLQIELLDSTGGIPEPASLSLIGFGMVGLAGIARCFRR